MGSERASFEHLGERTKTHTNSQGQANLSFLRHSLTFIAQFAVPIASHTTYPFLPACVLRACPHVTCLRCGAAARLLLCSALLIIVLLSLRFLMFQLLLVLLCIASHQTGRPCTGNAHRTASSGHLYTCISIYLRPLLLSFSSSSPLPPPPILRSCSPFQHPPPPETRSAGARHHHHHLQTLQPLCCLRSDAQPCCLVSMPSNPARKGHTVVDCGAGTRSSSYSLGAITDCD